MKLIFAVLLISCSHKYNLCKIVFKNDSNLNLDSVVVKVNEYPFKLYNLKPHTVDSIYLNSESLAVNHDVVYGIEVFNNDTTIAKTHIFSNDMGHIPQEFKIILKENMLVEQY